MAIKAAKGEKKFIEQENIAPGTYPARIVQIIDFGVQPQRPYQGIEKKPAREVGITYELVDEFMMDEAGQPIEDKPRWVSESFPLYSLMAENAKSTKRLRVLDPTDAWDGDIIQSLGKALNVTIVNNKVGDRVYDNIATTSAMRPRDAQSTPELQNPSVVFDLEEPNMEVFSKFPKWIQDKIKGNLNYQGSELQKLVGEAKPEAKKEEAPPAKEEEEDNLPY